MTSITHIYARWQNTVHELREATHLLATTKAGARHEEVKERVIELDARAREELRAMLEFARVAAEETGA